MANYDPVYLSIDNRPGIIVSTMDGLLNRRAQQAALVQRRKPIPRALFFIGLALIGLDLLLGYNSHVFIFAGAAAWIAMFFGWRTLRRAQLSQEFPPHFQTAREVVHTLRDDLHPQRNFLGQLDLTGTEQPGKLAREGRNALGLTVAYYRDEWLNLKTKLYDGNMLRVSAIRRFKVRQGYSKRGRISGKQKWKPPVPKGDQQELRVRIAANPQAYDIGPGATAKPGTRVGVYTIAQLNASGGIIDLAAHAPATTVSAGDMLGVLQLAYSLLQRKKA